MPGMGGVTLYQIVQERWPKTKMLFITGHPLDAQSRELLETGNVHWLQKPFSVQDLVRALKIVLASEGWQPG
jgi:CheY-like chemotaxis protein